MVSIIIPAYNAANFIAEAIRSVMNQGLTSFEIVMVNDASTDNTRKICESMLKKYKGYKIKYEEHQLNKGGGATRNTCVYLSQGDYIFNLDADNVLPARMLKELVRVAEANYRKTGQHAMVSPEYLQYFRDDPVSLFGHSLPIKRRVLMHRWHFDRLDYEFVLTNIRSPASSGNYLFHRSIFNAVGGYFEDCGPYDAWSFGIRCYLAGFRYLTVPGTFYFHRLHPHSYWTKNEKSGVNKEYLWKALCHLSQAYSQETLEKLNPANPDYPKDPFAWLRLRELVRP